MTPPAPIACLQPQVQQQIQRMVVLLQPREGDGGGNGGGLREGGAREEGGELEEEGVVLATGQALGQHLQVALSASIARESQLHEGRLCSGWYSEFAAHLWLLSCARNQEATCSQAMPQA